MNVGVLALQGDYKEHKEALAKIGASAVEIKLPKDLVRINRLIIPGGESTAIGKLLVLFKLLEPIQKRAKRGMPVWGTCAGAILMAKRIADGKPNQPSLSLMDVTARRNAFGRQLDSFETNLAVKEVSYDSIPVVFIRAPILESVGKNVVVLAKLNNKKVVAAKQGSMLATCFHPELTSNSLFHRYFLSI